ncbi:MAG: nicotinate-nucleotide adenylyltransferase [Ktedonobacteraceae bacterium]|nr:nicotinate-nucleotide adenylyltransferase [Ktedonobacteraceae bacterium]
MAQHRRRIGLIGGTFDPIHYGHLVVAEEVHAALQLDEMIFIPAGQPPHKKGKLYTPAHQRLAMLQLALATNPHFSISRIELDQPGPSYTAHTLRLLREQWGWGVDLFFVLGWDSLEELHKWHDPAGILSQLTALVAVGRPGYTEDQPYQAQLEARLPGITRRLLVVPTPQLAISSTDLRHRVASGRPIKYQLPEAVERYIIEHELYRQVEETSTRKPHTH